MTKFTPIIIVIFMLCFSGCKDSKEENEDTYFGGTIKNRSSDFIILKDNNSIVIDTFYLDKSGSFIHKFNDFKPGLYSYSDSKEAQYVFIEKGDSLIFRLNTIEFDESLVYTGQGSKENNYLVELFLESEKREPLFLKYSQLKPNDFKNKIDCVKTEKLKALKKFTAKNKTSDAFNYIAENNIKYQNYYSKEFYPFARMDEEELLVLNSLDEQFYDYRKNINANDEILKNYFPYKSFLRFHFNNLALQRHFKHSKDSLYNSTLLHYNKDRFKLINEKIKLQDIKNDLSYYYMVRYLNDSKEVKDFDAVFESFKTVNNNEDEIKNVSNIINAYKRLKPGLPLPDLSVINSMEKELTLHQIINEPTVLFFWSKSYQYHLRDAHKKAQELSLKYPEINFIAVNVDAIEKDELERILKTNQLPAFNEHRFKNPEEARNILSIRPINNVFLVTKNAKIVNPKANMFSVDFEHQLVELLNQK